MNNMDEKNCYKKCGSKKNISKAYKKLKKILNINHFIIQMYFI